MFKQSLKDGALGEYIFWNLCQKQDWVRSVVDVRADKDFQKKDIDFLVEDFKRQFTSFEIKTDFAAHRTGNIVYELTTRGNIGCFEKTQAKYIAYYVAESRQLYIINVSELRDYITKTRPNLIDMGEEGTGYLIKITDLQKNKVIKRTYEDVY